MYCLPYTAQNIQYLQHTVYCYPPLSGLRVDLAREVGDVGIEGLALVLRELELPIGRSLRLFSLK
jgi:hypothetical protein